MSQGPALDSFGARATLRAGGAAYEIHRLDAVADDLARLPYVVKVLLENLLRHEDGEHVTADDARALGQAGAGAAEAREIPFFPARVLMQDFTGVPAIVDLAALRDAMADRGGDARRIDPLVPVDLVIDHSIVVDVWAVPDAFERNAAREFERNRERYALLRWAQQAFRNLRVVPPNTGICHQVNLEHLASVVFRDRDGRAYPDTLVGTDSHTPMVNGLGVLGWGVGGIEAEAAMLGQPLPLLTPRVVGIRVVGELREGATATDLVLTVTELLRHHGVVGKMVEFFGPGVARVPLENRATIGNMSPEYGSTCSVFPIDAETLRYLRATGRPDDLVALVEAYAKEQGLWHDPGAHPAYDEEVELDLGAVEPSLAGPSRPQDRVPLDRARERFAAALVAMRGEPHPAPAPAGAGPSNHLPFGVAEATPEDASAESFPASDPPAAMAGVTATGEPDEPAGVAAPATGVARRGRTVRLADGASFEVRDGHVVIAAITSCTNTSNPFVMMAAGLLARKAAARGMRVPPWVKTSLAPGSKVVMDYFRRTGLDRDLAVLGFDLVGYGCTTCIGNSGPLPAEISGAIRDGDLSVCAVLSGNRNFEGRIHPDCRMNYLASPPLVVAYALAGSMDVDLHSGPLGRDAGGSPVFLREVWPSSEEVAAAVAGAVGPEMFVATYRDIWTGDERWQGLDVPPGDRFRWDPASTYVRRPPFLERAGPADAPLGDVVGARALAVLGDSVTTDHISPAGVIQPSGPAGRWLVEQGVPPADFNSYGARRGNHEVMVRGTFANIRLRNHLVPGVEGGVTEHLPSGDRISIFEAAERYQAEGVPLVVVAGRDYGSGSSRDWAAKGCALLGVRAVLAESYERIHRSNLVGMGVLPLQFEPGDTAARLGLTGREVFDVLGVDAAVAGAGGARVTVRAGGREFPMTVRVDTPREREAFRAGGILPAVLRTLAGGR